MLPELGLLDLSSNQDRIYHRLRAFVSTDRCRVGQKLPTCRELAKHFRIGLTTAHQALRRLEKEGWVSCEVGRGTYLRRMPKPAENEPERCATIPSIAVLTGPIRQKIDMHDPGTEWTARIVLGVQQGLAEAGYAARLVPLPDERKLTGDLEQGLFRIANALSGVIAFPLTEWTRLLPALDRRGLPWVTINQYDHLSARNYVTADYYGGGVEIGRLFGQLGLERVLFLKLREHSFSSLQKENGMRDGLSACGISLKQVESRGCDSHLRRDGWKVTRDHLRSRSRPPQAVFAMGDLLALGAIQACQERGLRVPEDVAVAGSTGIEAGEHSTPTLTAVQAPMTEIGIEAARILLTLIRKKEKETPGKILPMRLILRGSTPGLARA